MKIALIGGHLSPALALLDILPSTDEVVFFGRKYALEGDRTPSLEFQTISKRHIPFISLTTGRIQRKPSLRTAVGLSKVPLGYFQALVALAKHKPDVVVGFGGYLSVPVCLAAKTLSIPVVIHEQTLEAGLANKVIAPFADKVCISWERSRVFFPEDKVILTGNPLKKFSKSETDITFLREEKGVPMIYVTGGSTGAHAINVLIEKSLPDLVKDFRILHQIGDAQEFSDFDRLEKLRMGLPVVLQNRYYPQKFINPTDVGSIMRKADLVVSRSGINTVTELLSLGVPSLLIPLPYGQKNEQLKNAQFIKEIGLAEILDQQKATPEDLVQLIYTMIQNKEKYLEHVSDGKRQIKEDAAEKLREVLGYVVKKTTS